MSKKSLYVILTLLIGAAALLAGCSSGPDIDEKDPEDSLSYSNIPLEFHSAVRQFYDEEGYMLEDPVYTVEYDDHTVMFFLNTQDDEENPRLISASFCRDDTGDYFDGDYYIGSFEIDDVKTCTSYHADIPAAFYNYPDYQYGCNWIAGPKTLLNDLYADRVDKEIKIDDTYSVYIDKDEEGGEDTPYMQTIWAYYREQGILSDDDSGSPDEDADFEEAD